MTAKDVSWILISYLIGSLSWGVIAGFLHGIDLRKRDLPGGSGVFRQLGPAWGAAVALLDIGKGALAAWLLHFAGAALAPWLAAAVVAGHCWPVFFGFSGGGGLAPSFGFLLTYRTQTTIQALLLISAVALAYYPYWKRRGGVLGIYPLPFAALFGYGYALWALRGDPTAFKTVLATSLVVVVRGLQLLKGRR